MYKSSWGDVSSESISQVIVALSSLDIDCKKDKRFIKNSNDLISNLYKYKTKSGFKHIIDGETDPMATDQSLYALISYYRLISGKNKLYDMTIENNDKKLKGNLK